MSSLYTSRGMVLVSLMLTTWWVGAKPVSINANTDLSHLLTAYLQLGLVKQMPHEAASLAAKSSDAVKQQVQEQAKAWSSVHMNGIRAGLEKRFGENAKGLFKQFIQTFTTKEREQDTVFLREMCQRMGMEPSSKSYQELREAVAGTLLAKDMTRSSTWLGEVQTWIDVQQRNTQAPPLNAWLARNEKETVPSQASSAGSSKEVDPLEAAEAPVVEYVDLPEEEQFNPLDSFMSARETKRKKALEASKAGMDMVAQERQAWESAHAQKKQAAAQKEAAAMKRQAELLAQAEEEALKQRQKSWGNRLKKLVASAAGSFAGGVSGGLATRATEEAVNELWP